MVDSNAGDMVTEHNVYCILGTKWIFFFFFAECIHLRIIPQLSRRVINPRHLNSHTLRVRRTLDCCLVHGFPSPSLKFLENQALT